MRFVMNREPENRLTLICHFCRSWFDIHILWQIVPSHILTHFYFDLNIYGHFCDSVHHSLDSFVLYSCFCFVPFPCLCPCLYSFLYLYFCPDSVPDLDLYPSLCYSYPFPLFYLGSSLDHSYDHFYANIYHHLFPYPVCLVHMAVDLKIDVVWCCFHYLMSMDHSI